MSFQDSACQIEVIPSPGGSTSLVAICNNEEGSGLTSDIVLDEFLGNENGNFSWTGQNFTQSARSVGVSREGPRRVPILHAELLDDSGVFQPRHIELARRIGNINGELVLVEEELIE
ncbi:Cyanovirin-N [Aspergillus campestris IBT 28561]|uniref:Cyanovirin-N n=1 Tax=Aspergillus campestris (strain IBT 28561) TaxID=1392248 RepID=A0A2I1CTY2_ASPC2|nr:Cyanovirin-N [Aspergillus campestris IBT 28561]PKY01074.1 Cyanovirin-N [Aspergillus campestris IBT 28561]